MAKSKMSNSEKCYGTAVPTDDLNKLKETDRQPFDVIDHVEIIESPFYKSTVKDKRERFEKSQKVLENYNSLDGSPLMDEVVKAYYADVSQQAEI